MLLVTSRMQQYAEQMQEALRSEDLDQAARLDDKVSALRAARILLEAPFETIPAYLQRVGWVRAGQVTANLPREMILRILQTLTEDDAGSLLAELPAEQIPSLLDDMPDDLARALRQQLDPEFRQQIELLASYPEGSAGAIMSPYFLAVEPGVSVREAIDAVRSAPPEIGRTAYVFVVDPGGRLRGVVSLRELMVSDPGAPVSKVMSDEVFVARTGDLALEAARRIRSRRLKMLPVVDAADVLQGVVSIDRAMDLLEHELADGIVAINAASPDESFFTPPRQAVRKRLPWMAANVFLNLGAVAVISSFEDTIVQVAILAAFLPMITDMGGNVGIQALSVSIRSMALGEARLRDFWVAVRKEATIGLVNGLALGLLFCGVAYVFEGNMVLGLVAGTALACNVLVAGVVGGTMPFLIKRLGKDPAMMTGPVLTTITDITGVTIYLGLSTIFLASLMV